MPHLILPFCSRSSTFKDKDIAHKYGELTLVNRKGKKYKLSKLLIKSTFAMYNENIFLQLLEAGNIETKLSDKKTEEMKSILKHYKSSKKFNSWPVKTVETLTVEKVQLHNKIIEEEGSDFINDSHASDEEEPLGRGIRLRDHSGKQIRYIKTINDKYIVSEDSPKPIESCSSLNETDMSTTKSLESETLPKGLSSLLLKRRLGFKESQKKEISNEHPLPDSLLSTKSLHNGFNTDDVTENIHNEIITNKQLHFEHDDKIRQATSENEDVHVKTENNNEHTLEIIKKRKSINLVLVVT